MRTTSEAPAARIVIDSEGTLLKLNRAARKILAEDQGLGKGTNLGSLLALFIGRQESNGGMPPVLSLRGNSDSPYSLAIMVQQGPETSGWLDASSVSSLDGPQGGQARLTSYITHELKNRLGIALGVSKVLTRRYEALSATDVTAGLQDIESELEESLLTLETILRLSESRPEGDDGERIVPLHVIVRQAVAKHQRLQPERQIRLFGDSPVYVLGNSMTIGLAVANLFAYVEKQAVEGERIDVRVHDDGIWSSVLVTKRGQNGAAHASAALWDIGADGPVPAPASGPEIALLLSRDLVESLGGKVWAGAIEDETAFSISLRVAGLARGAAWPEALIDYSA